jgi:membrane associated rhomboid family serine protease
MYAGNAQFSFGRRLTPWVKRLLIANVVIFLITRVSPDLFNYWLAFDPSRILTQPWGAFTYMFMHGGLMHLLLNMLVLFFFGPPLEAKWGSYEFIKFYVICGLGAVVLSFFNPGASIIGASGAIYGLMLAFAMNWPEAPIYIWGIFPVKAKWLVGFFFVISLMETVGGSGGNIAHFAHLGGILTGFLYLKSDWRPGRKAGHKRPTVRIRKMAPVPRDQPARRAKPETPPEGQGVGRDESILDEVDRILDKISAEGMTALTPKERETLDNVSKRHRTN